MSTLEKKKQTNDKKSQAYSFFISKGYTPEQSAGIVGNLIKESSLNTKAEGDIGYAGGSSFGIAQWRGDRLTKLKNMYGNNWSDFNNQLEYIHWELNNTETKAGQALKNAKDVHSAGAVMSDLYERPKVKYNQDKTRQKFVTDVYKSLVNSDYEYVVPQQEQTDFDPTHYNNITKPLTNLPQSNVNTIFAGVSDSALPQEKIEEQTDKDITELQTKTAEQNFLEELYQNREIVEQPRQIQHQQQKAPVDYMQMYEQVSNFVDTPLIGGEEQMMQQGGKYDESRKWIQNWYKNREIPNQGELPNISEETYPDGTPYNERKIESVYQQGGGYTENELAFLSEIKGIPISSRGLYDYPKQEVIVPTTDGRITMKGIDYDVLGIDEFGNKKVMKPNGEYKFKGKTIREIPLFKK